jgi:hypothetical protein
MENSNWYKNVLLKNAKEIVGSAATYVILALIFLLWYFILGIKFEWQQIKPLSPPSIFIRSFYSAFVFCTLGFFLYVIRFYKVMHDILVKVFGLWTLYNFIKAVIWAFLIYVSYQYIVPWLFTLLNTSVSILYNIVGFILYTLPPLGMSLVVVIFCLIWKHKKLSK